jgi:hypothetical protein
MKWLELSDERKQLLLDQASAKLSAPKNALEKDWWVTVALRAIFNTPFAKDIVFKGGTSLSKSWQLISRSLKTLILQSTVKRWGSAGN